MKKVFVITWEGSSGAGHGEPPSKYLCLKTQQGEEYFGYGKPQPAFTTREKAQAWLDKNGKYSFNSITELEVI